MQNEKGSPKRAPYNSPELRVYGGVAELTQASAGMNGNDHAGGGSNKTR